MDSSATSPKKAKKTAAPKKPAAHPAYKDMVAEAIRILKERNGSSRQKIAKYLQSNYKGIGDESALKRNLKASLKKLVASGSLIQTKGVGASGSFKLPAAAKKPAAVKKPATAKKVAKKPAAAKKATAKKAATSVKKSPAKKKASTPKKASG
ncbi:histone H1-like, partial [Rhopilema esculentum]|uniref:histone H1-like n=1 Tax=Rhopilema esculentum TaxID=499914 RepID=UPI0031E16082